MKRHDWKLLILGAAVAVGSMLFSQPADARFPGMDITLWDPHQAKEDRKNSDYIEFHKLVEQKNYDEAMRLIDRVHQQNPQKGTPLILKSLLLYEMKRYKESYIILQQGRNIQPRHPAITFAHCRIYRMMGNVSLSNQACKISVHQHKDNPDAHYEYAQTLAGMGYMELANKELKRAAELDTTNATYHFERGMNFFYLNDLENAEKSFLKALSLNADDFESGYQLGYLYALQKKFKQAEKYLNPIWQTRQDHPKVEAARALIELIKKGDTGKLPATVDAHAYHLNRSRSLYQSGQYGLALFEIQTAARLKPNDKATCQILVAIASLLLHLDLTEQSVKKLISANPNDKILQAKGYQELGDMRVMRGQLDQGRDYYKKSEAMGDPDGLAKTSLAELPPQTPDTQVILDPKEPFFDPTEALNQKGEVFAHYGMYQRALALYSLALRTHPGHLMSKLNMAAVYFKMGMPHKTISLLERILVSHPNHEHILSHRALLAKAYAQKGNREKALENLKLIHKIKPSVLRALRDDPAFKDLKDNELFRQ
ncbi:MAG TPA: tetratricopeptide repeat protein [Desulfobacteria bacterium]|nr:tetratricopeptide repeat protein [Desulfobacteria bacterium]